jgi:redox-sensitive bicupin YhaK (pirin superfamily)
LFSGWPSTAFVMNSREEIAKAIREYHGSRYGQIGRSFP